MTLIRSIFQPKEFTGKHMLFSMVAFFGVIIAVNLIMARFAVTTWSGLVVPNTYVASQQFNAQAELSRARSRRWDIKSRFNPDPDGVSVLLTDSGNGLAGRVADSVSAGLRRPVGTLDDRELEFTARGPGVYTAGRTRSPRAHGSPM
jgi:nitrogen fixation protein FixH